MNVQKAAVGAGARGGMRLVVRGHRPGSNAREPARDQQNQARDRTDWTRYPVQRPKYSGVASEGCTFDPAGARPPPESARFPGFSECQ